ncbi:cytochrome P450 [Mycena olivaceomarginata]|nr:cytochrome P450 [Mycena olivaceomarginata]
MSVCTVFILAMTHWPEIQRKAREKIDRHVGRSRMPTFGDPSHPSVCSKLPSIFLVDLIRIAVPHASTEDDEYLGYFIPKGTTVISSIWSIHQDPAVRSDPESFSPERFLDEDGKEKNTEESRTFGHHVFDFGCWLCPGATMADHAVWVFAARCLWALEIRPLRDADGQVPEVHPLMFTSGGEAS